MRTLPARLLAAILTGIAASATLVASPASAAACPPGAGVTVVVNSSASCDADGGGSAADNFRDAGHSFTYVDREPGFVCKIDGAPSSARCVDTPPSNAYWSLWLSDGASGWTFSSQGVDGLKIPSGGYVGFVFGNGKTPPSVNPVSAKPAVKPTAQPTKKPAPAPTKKPSAKPSAATPAPTAPKGAVSATPTPAAAAAPTATPTPTSGTTTPAPATSGPTPVEPTPTAAPTTPGSTDGTTPVADDTAADADGSGPLGWVAGALIVALLGGMGAVMWRRRASGGAS